MLTSILLLVALLPGLVALDGYLPDSWTGQIVRSLPPFQGEDPVAFNRGEAADEESEEEELDDGQGRVDDRLSACRDVVLVVIVSGSISSPHLRSTRDRSGCPRSPP